MKRIICIALVIMLLAPTISGCRKEEEDGVTNIVCTVFPIYDWVRNIVDTESEEVSLELIVKNGTDAHSYSPTPADIARISSCDILIYVGGESDAWISDVLRGDVNKDMKVIRLLDELHGESEGESHEGHSHEHSENAYDEHIWLSLRNAKTLCLRLGELISEEIPEQEETIAKLSGKYLKELSELDAEYADAVIEAEKDTLLFADRFPFGYLLEDYGLKHYAAFEGCAADTEASFETITFLANKLRELSLGYVIILESSDGSLADTVITGSRLKDVSVLVMDSMQSVTESDIEKGRTYLSIMYSNLMILKTALA